MKIDELTKSLTDLGWTRSKRDEYGENGPYYFYRPLWNEWHNDHGYYTVIIEIRDESITISARYGMNPTGWEMYRPINLTHPDIAPTIALLIGAGYLK
jgi:hypothetical protein